MLDTVDEGEDNIGAEHEDSGAFLDLEMTSNPSQVRRASSQLPETPIAMYDMPVIPSPVEDELNANNHEHASEAANNRSKLFALIDVIGPNPDSMDNLAQEVESKDQQGHRNPHK